jgi:hypothetical protein
MKLNENGYKNLLTVSVLVQEMENENENHYKKKLL